MWEVILKGKEKLAGKRGRTSGLEKMGTNCKMEARGKRRWRLSYLSRSLGDTRSLLCESIWFGGRVYRGGRLIRSARMRWVSLWIRFDS